MASASYAVGRALAPGGSDPSPYPVQAGVPLYILRDPGIFLAKNSEGIGRPVAASAPALFRWSTVELLTAGCGMEEQRSSPLWWTECRVRQQICCDADDDESHDKHRHPIGHFPLRG